MTQDDAGRIYRNTNESALHVDYVPTPYFARNPEPAAHARKLRALASDTNALNTVWPVRPNPGTNRAYQAGIDRPDGTLAKFTAVCAPLVYRGDRLPADVYGNVFVAEPAANLVSRIVLSDDGTTLRARKAYEQGRVPGVDRRALPAGLSLQRARRHAVHRRHVSRDHRASPVVTVYLRDHILRRKLEQPTGFGRIYRVVHETTQRDTSEGRCRSVTGAAGRDAVASERLVARHGAAAARRARATARSVPRAATKRSVALTSGDQGLADAPARAVDAGRDRRDRAGDGRHGARRSLARRARRRRSASRSAGLATPQSPIQAAVLKRLDDEDWAVRQQLAASLGAMPPGDRDGAGRCSIAMPTIPSRWTRR